jgi:hypothetical protein
MADDALSFHVTNANLNSAIEILRRLGGLERYPEAYQVLVHERSRRQLQSPSNEIRLARAVFEALPPYVQRLLTAQPS